MFIMKNYRKFLYFLCIWNAQHFIEAKTKSITDDISEEFYSCDYTRFDSQLERLKLQASINHQVQLSQQKELFSNMQKKLNDLSLQIEGVQGKLLEANRINIEDLKVLTRHETQTEVPIVTPAVDDKTLVLIDIKEKLKDHDHKMLQILSNQNEIQQLLNKIHLEDYTQTMKNTISEKFSNIERYFMPQNISQEVLNNQNDIKNLLKAINLEDHTQSLKSTKYHELAALQQIDEKLTNIEHNSVTKSEQLKFYHDIQQYLNVTEVCRKAENNNLTFTNLQTYPTSCANFDANYCAANKCLIKNDLYGSEPFWVSCNNSVNGDGWTVIQRRINGSVDFYRNWSEYKVGFGDIDGEFFIGFEKLHALTSTLKPMELLIQLGDFDNVMKYAKFDDFQVYQDPKHRLGIVWYGFHGYEYSLKFVQMSVRPKKAINIK